MVTSNTIPLNAVALALMSAKLRRFSQGRTALLAAYTACPVLQVGCHHGTAPTASTLARAITGGARVAQVAPMGRGYIHQLAERIHLERGPKEVRKTFGAGIKALRKEASWVLSGGQKGGAA